MPATATHSTTTRRREVEQYHCYRCSKDKPRTTDHWYFRSDGSIISACKECHATMNAERKTRRAKGAITTRNGVTITPASPPSGPAQLPLGIVEDARPEPAMVQYRCEGCGRGSITANPEGPRGWKRVRLTGRESESPATLCPRCTAAVARAFQVVRAVSQRRATNRKTH